MRVLLSSCQPHCTSFFVIRERADDDNNVDGDESDNNDDSSLDNDDNCDSEDSDNTCNTVKNTMRQTSSFYRNEI